MPTPTAPSGRSKNEQQRRNVAGCILRDGCGNECAQREKAAMRHIDDAHDAVDEAQPGGDQEKNQA